VTPTFNTIGPLCQNSTAPALPGISLNGITGTWSPLTINTAVAGSTTYTFTSTDATQCATTASISVTVTPQVTPTFNTIGPLCQNSTAPALPGISLNGITGTWSPVTINTAVAGSTTYTFTSTDATQCATTASISVTVTPQVTPTFNTIGPLCQNSTAPALPGISLNGITGTWSPLTINTAVAGSTTYTFTSTDATQCATTASISVTVTPQVTPTFNTIGPLCQNSTAPALPGISLNGITGTWSPLTINTAVAGSTTYTFTSTDATQCATTASISVTVTPQVTPTFNTIGPLCQNSTAPALPGISLNGITGTWSPLTINTAVAGSTTYTFTSTDATQCATTASISVTVTPQVTPTFNTIGPLCQNSTAPALPGISLNGITGTWSPLTINTAVAGSTTYTFTSTDATQCATTASISVTVTPQVTPTFNTIGPLCQNSTAPALPGISLNGITGTWSPLTINTAVAGSTTYTFTSTDATQCATTASISVTVTPQVTPTFNTIGPLCQNSTAPALPGISLNGITGTWSPLTINTAVAGSTTYTFTSTDATQCATTASISVTVTPQVTPTFNTIGPLCQNSTAPALPGISLNGITGTWSPLTINTAVAGSTTYTFTSTDATQCATTASISVTVTPQVTPTFNTIGPLCQNSTAPALPGISLNGITGTWSPLTINTAVAGSTTYTFTSTDATQCATTASISVTVTPQVTPTFNTIGPLCQNSTAPALPGISLNGITGTWSPLTINTAVAGSTTYTFTSTDATQCATTASISVTVTPQVTPTFNTIGPLCQNSTAPALPGISLNGITGTWSPLTINTAVAGSTTYTFTSTDATQCATTASISVTVTPQVTPTFNTIGPLCQNSTAPALPGISLNGITGTWSPLTINTAVAGSTTYTFTSTDATQCATTASISVTVTPQVTPTFNTIGPLCQNSTAPALPGISLNGITGTWSPLTINTAVAGSTTYTFTSTDATQCATTASISVTVTPQVTPTFNTIGPLCQNSTAPALPGISLNGITGTWSPLTINTAVAGSTTYTFTSTDATQCATTASISVTVTPQVTPTFNTIGPLCQNSTAPALPGISLNGITGTWSPLTINTAVAGSTTYTFTSTDATQCATTASISVTVTPQVTPTFNTIGPLCQNSTAPALPGISLNGITGTWSPLTINTAVAGSTTYTFTSTDATQCATTASISVTVTPQVTPTFNTIGPLCQNSTAPALPGILLMVSPVHGVL
jgi:hypothetical protein